MIVMLPKIANMSSFNHEDYVNDLCFDYLDIKDDNDYLATQLIISMKRQLWIINKTGGMSSAKGEAS